jgi:hypothetical protein
VSRLSSDAKVLISVPSWDESPIINVLLEVLAEVWKISTKYFNSVVMTLGETPH